ncbi:sensor domain-containing diguanylate cyclase [Bordetella sp. 15P40C-2]|uniref:GGDEF domain-containing protein n=1 Tax=Bordetella sp. 15P40C-2 TaxID=2572246 RepID=UPI001323598A|nr:sensor domain-containing diguanylate cyclase [Bordetella sp. 15P40C-2]MVW71798.1 diguanylate cyclase [Bordetella sp. 15P40C-2]
MNDLLERISQSISQARSLEGLTRPLLEMLQEITGFESTYLTAINLAAGTQQVVYAHNTSTIEIPEGLSVPWGDTLCKRALDEGTMATADVATRWADSEAAAALGIHSYISVPVYAGEGVLYGTLCAASSDSSVPDSRSLRVLSLFATLIGAEAQRNKLLTQLLEANALLASIAARDGLTGLHNRRSLIDTLQHELEVGKRQGTAVFVGFLDLDGFKRINDTHGHTVGDRFLVAMANNIRQTMRAQDVVARYGGDELVVFGPGPTPGPDLQTALQAFTQRLADCTVGSFDCAGMVIHYGGASVGAIAVLPDTLDALTALEQADQAMYRVKLVRRNQRHPKER